jgi:hypothetical protein
VGSSAGVSAESVAGGRGTHVRECGVTQVKNMGRGAKAGSAKGAAVDSVVGGRGTHVRECGVTQVKNMGRGAKAGSAEGASVDRLSGETSVGAAGPFISISNHW